MAPPHFRPTMARTVSGGACLMVPTRSHLSAPNRLTLVAGEPMFLSLRRAFRPHLSFHARLPSDLYTARRGLGIQCLQSFVLLDRKHDDHRATVLGDHDRLRSGKVYQPAEPVLSVLRRKSLHAIGLVDVCQYWPLWPNLMPSASTSRQTSRQQPEKGAVAEQDSSELGSHAHVLSGRCFPFDPRFLGSGQH